MTCFCFKTEQAKAEIQFWSNGLEEFNNQPIWHKASAVRVVYSDASDTGYGGLHSRAWALYCSRAME